MPLFGNKQNDNIESMHRQLIDIEARLANLATLSKAHTQDIADMQSRLRSLTARPKKPSVMKPSTNKQVNRP